MLRAWERRHGAVAPQRAPSNRRLYSDADIERLTLLRRATLMGRSIGQLSALTDAALRDLVLDDAAAVSAAPAPGVLDAPAAGAAHHALTESLRAVRDLDPRALRATLAAASFALSAPELVEQVLVPLMRSVGQAWAEGEVGISHEHMASAVVRAILSELAVSRALPDAHPAIVVATPAGQHHELGALVVAGTAAWSGWRVTYLGADLPTVDIAAAARRVHAAVVAVSITHPADDSALPDALRILRAELAAGTTLLAGGIAAAAYTEVLHEIGALVLGDVRSLRAILVSLRGQHREVAA